MSRIIKTKHVKCNKTGKCKCRLDTSVFNSKKTWNKDKCRCKCNKLIDKGVGDKRFNWNPGNCECECDKSCDVGEYLDYANCKCRKKLFHKLVEGCTEIIDEVKITQMALFERGNKCKFSCIIYVVLIAIVFTISIGTYFIYYNYMIHQKETASKYDYIYQTQNY